VGGGTEEETNIDNVKFKFSFNEKSIYSDIRMPVEYDNIASFMEKIDADPVITFDDLEQFEPLE